MIYSKETGIGRRMRNAIGVVLGATLCVSGLVACTAGGAESDSHGTDLKPVADTPDPAGAIDSFTWAIYAEPNSLDFAFNFDYPSHQVLSNVCESLLTLDSDFKIQPNLATSSTNPDPLTWVYEIREGVTFHDGSPLRARDVVSSFRRHLDPNVGSWQASFFKNVESIEESNPMEVTISLKTPDPLLNSLLAAIPGVIESADTLAANDGTYGTPDGTVNCTGPYELDAWNSGESITLKRYAKYWDPERVGLAENVKFVFIGDDSARVNAMLAGDIDGSWWLPGTSIKRLSEDAPGSVYLGESSTVNALIVSNLNGPLKDNKVRTALMKALDREGIIKASEGGYAEPTNSVIPRITFTELDRDEVASAYGKINFEYDIEAAKQLVEDAGASGETIRVAYGAGMGTAAVIAQALEQAGSQIGLVVKIETLPADQYGAVFVDEAARAPYDLLFTNNYTVTGDPQQIMQFFTPGDWVNYGGYDDPAFDKLFDQASNTMDLVERQRVLLEANQVVSEGLPWLPISAPYTTVYLSDRITGVRPSGIYLFTPWANTIGAFE